MKNKPSKMKSKAKKKEVAGRLQAPEVIRDDVIETGGVSGFLMM